MDGRKDYLKYLGINLRRKVKNVYKENCKLLMGNKEKIIRSMIAWRGRKSFMHMTIHMTIVLLRFLQREAIKCVHI